LITIIDGHNLINRHHFAINYLHTSEGLPIGGLFGCIQSILKLFKERTHDEYFVFVWDSSPQKKKKVFSEYKGSRVANLDVHFQKDEVKKVLLALDIQQFEINGEEADDVIATIAKKGRKFGHKIRIYSQDHDFNQLIRNNIEVYFPKPGNTYVKDVAWVKENLGIHPSQLADVMRLTGDPGDDVGLADVMKHIGDLDKDEKFVAFGSSKDANSTAVKLIKANGNIQNIFKNVQEAKTFNRKGELVTITKNLASKLEKAYRAIQMMDDLVVLSGNVDMDFSLKTKIKPNWDKFEEILQMYEFQSMQKKIMQWKRVVNYRNLKEF